MLLFRLGDLHNQGHNLIGGMNRWGALGVMYCPSFLIHPHPLTSLRGPLTLSPSLYVVYSMLQVMAQHQTAVRDPAFFRWHKFIDDVFMVTRAATLPLF